MIKCINKSHQPLATGAIDVASGPFPTFPPTHFLFQGGVYPSLYPSPWTQHGGGKVSKPVLFSLPSDFCCHSFFDTFLVPPFFRHLALLEPTCSIFVSNLATKTRSKSIVFGVQDTTYVARS